MSCSGHATVRATVPCTACCAGHREAAPLALALRSLQAATLACRAHCSAWQLWPVAQGATRGAPQQAELGLRGPCSRGVQQPDRGTCPVLFCLTTPNPNLSVHAHRVLQCRWYAAATQLPPSAHLGACLPSPSRLPESSNNMTPPGCSLNRVWCTRCHAPCGGRMRPQKHHSVGAQSVGARVLQTRAVVHTHGKRRPCRG